MRKLILIALFVAATMGCGCSKDREASEENLIVKELPKMHLQGNLEIGEHRVIQSEEELYRAYTREAVMSVKELRDIDFSTQTLLIGREFYANQANLTYKFTKKDTMNYIFTVEINGLLARPDGFTYGMIVKKLPKEANIIFNIVKNNRI